MCQAILPKANEKPLWGCRLAVYLPTDTLLRGSGEEHRGINRLRMYQIRITSLKSLSPQYCLFCITYGSDVFVVKRKTLTFVKVYRLWGVVDNYHLVVIQLNFFYEVIYQL